MLVTAAALQPRLLNCLRCPTCRVTLEMRAADALACRGCQREYPLSEGVPRFVTTPNATARAYGYMWGRQASVVKPTRVTIPYHLDRLCEGLAAPRFSGLILDAGCGDGIDLANLALDPDCEVIGLELSDGGVSASLARIAGLPRAHLVQGDLLSAPLADDLFDGAYCYGVVHHTADPGRAMRELTRVLKPGARLLLYLYEDFSDRPLHWRLALGAVNSLRTLTTRCPPRLLMAVCRLMSPVVYVACTLPSRRFAWAARFPYRHGTHAWGLGGDLYDRFSAPIERRYSQASASRLAQEAGLQVHRIAQRRGWMIWAQKPA